MHPLDWALTLAPILLVLGLAIYTRRFVQSVADFLAGGRCAGRYLIANAYGESASGVANMTSKFEIVMISGFTVAFWNALSTPILLAVFASGFVIYRYRQTRALTLAQFFEMRYSRRFRLFMGCLAFVAGILNYGIFPAISSKFFVYFLGLPEHVLGGHVPTFAILMAAYLACVLAMLTVGGQITLMVTDCVEGLFSMLILLVVVAATLLAVGWTPVVDTLSSQPPDQSMINPFDAWKVSDFNLFYVLMTLALSIYGTMALQNTQGFNAAAKSAHESRMAGILGKWRLDVRIALLMGITVAAVAFLHHPSLADKAAASSDLLGNISDPQVRKQMTVAAALKYMLPVGIKGLFVSTLIMGLLAGDCSHVHSWGSIFVQDVLLPLRGSRPLPTYLHLRYLRLAMVGVAAFAFTFSLLFTQMEFIALWWQITNAIFISGAGAAIIGGLYWRRGTTPAAWSAVLTGAILSLAGIAAKQLHPTFPLNGLQVAFAAAAASSLVYVCLSLLTSKHPFNLDQLLHRGPYATSTPESRAAPRTRPSLLARLLGFNQDFTFRDKLLATSLVGWSLLLALITAAAVLWNLLSPWPLQWWSRYWLTFGIAAPFLVGAVTLVWFTIGGLKDTRDFFRSLRTLQRDANDNGQVRSLVEPNHPPLISRPERPQTSVREH